MNEGVHTPPFEEREYLRPLVECAENADARIYRTVRKDNTVLYDSNRYSVPLGTYNTQKEVCFEVKEGVLFIQTTFGDEICEHRITSGRGLLIQSQSHKRDKTSPLDMTQAALGQLLEGKADDFLQTIRTEKVRYARDQFKLIQALCAQYGTELTLQAIDFCQDSKLYSANYVKDYLAHVATTQPEPPIPLVIPVSDQKYHVTTQKRNLDVYVKAGGTK